MKEEKPGQAETQSGEGERKGKEKGKKIEDTSELQYHGNVRHTLVNAVP